MTPEERDNDEQMAIRLLVGFQKEMYKKMLAAREKGRIGWDDPEQCSIPWLAGLLERALKECDFVSAANYSMMLHFRRCGVWPSEGAIIAAFREHQQAGSPER